MTILIVDDDPGIRQLLAAFLAHHGYLAVDAPNGAAALRYLEDASALPDLLLVDLMMPEMDGAAFRQAQLLDPRLASIPMAVLSAAENVHEQAPNLTANAYVSKPIDFDALLAVVACYCGEQRQHGQ